MSASRPPILSRSAHDRSAHRRSDTEWLAAAWADALVLQVDPTGAVPTRAGSDRVELAYVGTDEVDQLAERTFLGEYEGGAYFSVPVGVQDGWSGLRQLGGALSELDGGLLTAATALTQWHRLHPRCPRCGAPTHPVSAGWARQCPVDDSLHFPRTDPAVIMLIHDGADRVVLGRQASWPAGRFSILAGFVEAGESAEAAVVREVREEVGIDITDVEYHSSQPWPFPASLMLGFTARVTGDATLRPEDDELAEAAWFTREEIAAATTWGDDPLGALPEVGSVEASGPRLRALPGSISIARQLLDSWVAG